MILSWIFTGLIAVAILFGLLLGNGAALSAAVAQGCAKAVELVLAMAGSICLWTGVGRLMEEAGITDKLAKLLAPLLHRLFPGTKSDPALARSLSANICANILGLGNAATPMGIRACQRMTDPTHPGLATDQMCRLVVLNTASIQLIPASVAAIRAGLGCQTPFDLLPAVWLTSLASAGAGLLAAYFLGRLWKK